VHGQNLNEYIDVYLICQPANKGNLNRIWTKGPSVADPRRLGGLGVV